MSEPDPELVAHLESDRRALAKYRREVLKGRELVRARAEIAQGIWPLCLGCEQPIDVRIDDGSWSDVGIGDYNHVGCGPDTLRLDRIKWDRDGTFWHRFKAWLGFA